MKFNANKYQLTHNEKNNPRCTYTAMGSALVVMLAVLKFLSACRSKPPPPKWHFKLGAFPCQAPHMPRRGGALLQLGSPDVSKDSTL